MLKIPEQAHKARLVGGQSPDSYMGPPPNPTVHQSPASSPWLCHCWILTHATSPGWGWGWGGKSLQQPRGSGNPAFRHWGIPLKSSSAVVFGSRAHFRKVIVREVRNQSNQTGRSMFLIEKCHLENFFSLSIYPSPKGQTPPPPNLFVTVVLLAALQHHREGANENLNLSSLSPPLCLSPEGGNLHQKHLLHLLKTASTLRCDMSSFSRSQL